MDPFNLEIPLHNLCAACPVWAVPLGQWGQTAYYVEVLTKVVARWRVLAVSTEIVYIVEYSIYRCVNKANHVFIYNWNINYSVNKKNYYSKHFLLHFDILISMTIDRNGYLSYQTYLDIVLIICVWLNHTWKVWLCQNFREYNQQ